ncbi:MAG: DUF1800 family protein [Pyrinomonadaceae bacterium]
MESRISRSLLRILTVFALVSSAALGIAAQSDEDPNSPTPILLSETETTRALAQTRRGFGRTNVTKITNKAFLANSKVVLYAANISLMDGEGANAFRIYALDNAGHQFRFPVLEMNTDSNVRDAFALTVLLTDELGFWGPVADGEYKIYLTWRGLASNSVQLAIGKSVGAIFGGSKKGNVVTEIPTERTTPPGTTSAILGKSSKGNVSPNYVGYRWSGDRMRFLEQATFGPTLALDSRLRRIGLFVWLAEQFDAPYPTNPYPNQVLKPANQLTNCDGQDAVVGNTPDVPPTCFRDTYSMYQPQTWFFKEAFYGDAQLRHRVAWALAQLWVTSGVDIQQGRHMVEYHKILSANAFGNFRTLMKQMTLNPAMGDYLDMSRSTRTNPNENYAREFMQLFTVGLFKLNQDGTVQCIENNICQPGNTPAPTYDQNNVNNLTRVLTGWNFCNPALDTCPSSVQGTIDFIDPMIVTFANNNVNNNNHDLTAKTLLSYPASTTTTINACTNCTTIPNIRTYANASLDQAVDNLFNHPNVGPFVSKILIQHLVTSDPTPFYVSQVAAVFNDNGFGVRGDMKAVIKAILLHPEARGDAKTDPNYGKLREPVQYATNILRTFNVRSGDGLSQSDGYVYARSEYSGMAQTPFLSPTVFNFYPPDYIIPGTAMPGPEFALMNTSTSIQRANFANRFFFTAMPVAVSTNAPSGTSLDFSDLQALSTADSTGNQLVDELNRRMLHSTMAATMKNTILTAVLAYPSTDPPINRVRQAIYLIATSSQYQVQR